MGQRIFLAFRSVLYISGFLLLLLWLVPQWLNVRSSWDLPSRNPTRWFGLVPLIPAAIITISCFINFFLVGKGTPAPFDAPRRLVVSGPYRYVRNPMYLGAGLVLLGCGILFAEFSGVLVGYALAIVVLVNFFVFLYEEPTLRHKFGAEYEDYSRNVRRWIPRATPWHTVGQPTAATR
jgi:protein-S-isoprenylcysteine O-methyltransferase Ste14